MVGLFNEFDNIRVLGFPESEWTIRTIHEGASECTFFSSSHFLELIDSFSNGKATEQDFAIRGFIQDISKAYDTKSIGHDYLPELYNDQFLSISKEFLLQILDLDKTTKTFISGKCFFPYIWKANATWDSCNFAQHKGKNRFLYYRFRTMDKSEFHSIVSRYLGKFFSIIQGNEIVAYDWLLPNRTLEIINSYLTQPIKQVCVWRDPRDRFLSCVKAGGYPPLDIEEHSNMVLTRIRDQRPSEHRLVVRFEDLILKYEETTQKIMNFLGIAPSHHVAPKTIFDPSISVANIGAWKLYPDQEFMKALENRLGDYCYYPKRENLSEESIALLRSSGNWEGI